jgi:hypothetical protein
MFSALALLMSLQVAHAESKPVAYVLCKLKGNVRTVRIDLDANGVCTTTYNKGGADKVIGSGRNQPSCQHFLDNVKVNLEKSNWKCRNVETSNLSESGK